MAHGREAARDLRYGRQGGRWLPPGVTPGTAVADLDRLRRRHRAAHRENPEAVKPWPDASSAPDLGNPDNAACGMTWEGLARMAHARWAAGAELTAHDLEAIRRHPLAPSLLPG